jgi:hypothetical protein
MNEPPLESGQHDSPHDSPATMHEVKPPTMASPPTTAAGDPAALVGDPAFSAPSGPPPYNGQATEASRDAQETTQQMTPYRQTLPTSAVSRPPPIPTWPPGSSYQHLQSTAPPAGYVQAQQYHTHQIPSTFAAAGRVLLSPQPKVEKPKKPRTRCNCKCGCNKSYYARKNEPGRCIKCTRQTGNGTCANKFADYAAVQASGPVAAPSATSTHELARLPSAPKPDVANDSPAVQNNTVSPMYLYGSVQHYQQNTARTPASAFSTWYHEGNHMAAAVASNVQQNILNQSGFRNGTPFAPKEVSTGTQTIPNPLADWAKSTTTNPLLPLSTSQDNEQDPKQQVATSQNFAPQPQQPYQLYPIGYRPPYPPPSYYTAPWYGSPASYKPQGPVGQRFINYAGPNTTPQAPLNQQLSPYAMHNMPSGTMGGPVNPTQPNGLPVLPRTYQPILPMTENMRAKMDMMHRNLGQQVQDVSSPIQAPPPSVTGAAAATQESSSSIAGAATATQASPSPVAGAAPAGSAAIPQASVPAAQEQTKTTNPANGKSGRPKPPQRVTAGPDTPNKPQKSSAGNVEKQHEEKSESRVADGLSDSVASPTWTSVNQPSSRPAEVNNGSEAETS